MLFEWLAVIVAGVAAGGVASLARRLAGTLPRVAIPVAAGGAMLLAAAALEYAWYPRTLSALPERVEVALAHESRAPWRPWTYARPYVDRFVAIDAGSVLTNPAAPDRRIADVLVFARWVPPRRVRAVFDCAGGRRADLVEGAALAEGGAVEGAAWVETGLDDPVTRLACAGA